MQDLYLTLSLKKRAYVRKCVILFLRKVFHQLEVEVTRSVRFEECDARNKMDPMSLSYLITIALLFVDAIVFGVAAAKE